MKKETINSKKEALQFIDDEINRALAEKAMKGDVAAARAYDNRLKKQKLDKLKKELWGL